MRACSALVALLVCALRIRASPLHHADHLALARRLKARANSNGKTRVVPSDRTRITDITSSTSTADDDMTTVEVEIKTITVEAPTQPAPTTTEITRPTLTTPVRTSASASSTPKSTKSNVDWNGASSYYLYALKDDDRHAVLDAIASAGMNVVRIFVAGVEANNKGSGNPYVPDLEPDEPGTYDDTVLERIDQLMVDCAERGLKLLVALGDRYALGFWHTDSYALSLGIVGAGTSGVQKVTEADAFYANSKAMSLYDRRIQHILTHKNELMGGKAWSDLDDVVYAYEPQNEPQGYFKSSNPGWSCDRAATIRRALPSDTSILISTGGGTDLPLSLGNWAMNCDHFDVISVHSYDNSAIVNGLSDAKSKVEAVGKKLILGEWGAMGDNKADAVKRVMAAAKEADVPSMIWQITRPGKKADDFEIWTDEPAWNALKSALQ